MGHGLRKFLHFLLKPGPPTTIGLRATLCDCKVVNPSKGRQPFEKWEVPIVCRTNVLMKYALPASTSSTSVWIQRQAKFANRQRICNHERSMRMRCDSALFLHVTDATPFDNGAATGAVAAESAPSSTMTAAQGQE